MPHTEEADMSEDETMTPYERKVLEIIAGPAAHDVLSEWGAAMSVALEWLQGKGYVSRGPRPCITAAGRAALEEK
jgi:hypothetical protein